MRHTHRCDRSVVQSVFLKVGSLGQIKYGWLIFGACAMNPSRPLLVYSRQRWPPLRSNAHVFQIHIDTLQHPRSGTQRGHRREYAAPVGVRRKRVRFFDQGREWATHKPTSRHSTIAAALLMGHELGGAFAVRAQMACRQFPA